MIIIVSVIGVSFIQYNLNRLPHGKFLTSSYSPDKTYLVNAYLFEGNATTDFAVRCEVVTVSTNEKRNIYWQYHQETADIRWLDDSTVFINEIKLNVLTDSYDYREHGK